jgi:hypothetical protein
VPQRPCKLPIAPMGDSCFAHCLQGGGVYVQSGTVMITSSSITGNTAYYVRAHVQKFPSPRWENALLTCPFPFSSLMMGAVPRSTSIQYVLSAPETSKVPIAPMGDSRFARCLQGGGVYVGGGSVTIDSCTISGNTATVRAHVQKFPSPQWETHVLIVACRAVVSMSWMAQ